MKPFQTQRLILRTWKEEDALPYFRINQDPLVLEHQAGPLTMEQVQDFIARMHAHQETYGYSLWAVELKETGDMIGFIGLQYVNWEAHFTPAVEVGWRLASEHWGHGYATEGAKAALDYGFTHCHLKEIVSFTAPENQRSIRVMERIGMQRDPHGDFAHPKLPPDHRLSYHVLYRMHNSLP